MTGSMVGRVVVVVVVGLAALAGVVWFVRSGAASTLLARFEKGGQEKLRTATSVRDEAFETLNKGG